LTFPNKPIAHLWMILPSALWHSLLLSPLTLSTLLSSEERSLLHPQLWPLPKTLRTKSTL